MGRYRDLKDIQEQKAIVKATLDKLDPEYEDYKNTLEAYKKLVETEEIIRSGSTEREQNRLSGAVKVLSLIATTATAIFVPVHLANLAYEHDKNLDMKNGTIWNLIGKRFDRN